MTHPVIRTHELGQSIWLDDLQRELLSSGALAAMVAKEGLRGVTTNPAIFDKAITSTDHYDSKIACLVAQGLGDARTVVERLMIDDVRDAADVLRPVFDASGGRDGHVSIEVDPALARDSKATIAEARQLAERVSRPNLMIKIPATEAGLSAIESLIAEGINVNATLIFSSNVYRRVSDAFQRGLEQRAADGLPLAGIASVASFFVSRIDTEVDRQLSVLITQGAHEASQPSLQDLLGRAAVAVATLAYKAYLQIVADPRWIALASLGARPQRLLWASTGTKNPAYPKTKYVDALIGPDTVNTLPLDTFRAFAAGPEPRATLVAGIDAAIQTLAQLEQAGVRLGPITEALQTQGIQLFAEAFDRLISGIEKKLARPLRQAAPESR